MDERIDTIQRVELSEGVVVGLRTAGPMARGMAWLLDLLIRFGIYVGASMVLGFLDLAGFGIGTGMFILVLFLGEWGYFTFFEAGPKGATPGKRALGLRVVQPSGVPITVGQAVTRNFIRFVDFLPFVNLAGLMCCIMTKHFQRLGDLAANTVVIYEPPKASLSTSALPPTIMPAPPSAPLSREEQWAVSTFLDRMELWSDERKEELANHVIPLTGAPGREGVRRLMNIAAWIQQSQSSA